MDDITPNPVAQNQPAAPIAVTEPTPSPVKGSPNKKVMMAAGVIIAVLLVVIIIGFFIKPKSKTVAAKTNVAQVVITSDGFNPATLTVPVNTVVEWDSTDTTTTHIVAADPYPSHKDLPGLVSGQLGNGATYKYTFSKTGTFTYHDDLKPTTTGTIVVK